MGSVFDQVERKIEDIAGTYSALSNWSTSAILIRILICVRLENGAWIWLGGVKGGASTI